MANYWTDSLFESFEFHLLHGVSVRVSARVMLVLVSSSVLFVCVWCVCVGGGGWGLRAVNSQHAIREKPHVYIICGIRRERGRGGAAVMRTAVC